MSAKEHDHPHDHGHEHHDHGHDHAHPHTHEDTAQEPLAATPTHGYWKSLRELEGKAPWQLEPTNREFAPGADEPPPIDPMSRRNFFHLMGASMGLAGIGAVASGCRYEKEEIVPLAKRPDTQVPGTTLEYATTYDLAGVAHALVATSFEGRPIHLDGNPEHPFAGGPIVSGTKRHAGASTFAQAAILHLYDPDRSQTPLSNGKGASMEAFKAALAEIKTQISKDATTPGATRVLAEASSSPTLHALKRKLEQQGVVWHEYEPLSWDNEREGTRLAFGRPMRPLAKLDKCETIVTIDCDLFVEHPASMRYSRDFARSRQKGGSLGPDKMNRLWVAESVMSNTGAMADHRLGMRSELGLPFAMALDASLSGGGLPNSEFLKESKVAQFISVLTEELKANAGRAVVIAGRRQPKEVHALVAKINATIGAPGATLDYAEDPEPTRVPHVQSIKALAGDMMASKVNTLIILGGNPVYDAPADCEFETALGKVKNTSLHLSEYADETSLKTKWHVPKAHFLEAWGDARTWDGTISIAQPLIAPIYGAISSIELLSMLLGDEKTGEKLVRDTLETMGHTSWKQHVHDGFVTDSAFPAAQVAATALPAVTLSPGQQAGSKRKNGELEVVYHFSAFTYDGRFANNPWLWETPDFLTKVTWDNYALVSPETAVALGVKNDDLISVKVGNRSIKVPCYTMPGQAKYSIGLVLGGGRTASGKAGAAGVGKSGTVSPGFNTYVVRETAGFDYAPGASVSAAGHYALANVQDHWNYKPGSNKLMKNDDSHGMRFDFEVERRAHDLVEETTSEELEKNKTWRAEEDHEYWDDTVDAKANKQKARHLSLFEEKEYHGHRWGMAIDLNLCTGCNACMVACQSENNVPTVGRAEVMHNREMHWIRIDRYFTGTPEDPHVVHQPLPCQQCENAPCEQVCPVGATSHSDEGLNDMAYNRCIGTRYCANNCPYKVRRFNFLDWNKEFREARQKVRRLLFNPDVTVRMRGVMEKCTFCVQRIQNGKIRAKAEIRNPVPGVQAPAGAIGEPLPDGYIETACQMACPTEAIVFGDLQDPNSRVAKLHADRRGYALLPEMYTKPRNRYLTRVLNPHPKMPQPPKAEGGH